MHNVGQAKYIGRNVLSLYCSMQLQLQLQLCAYVPRSARMDIHVWCITCRQLYVSTRRCSGVLGDQCMYVHNLCVSRCAMSLVQPDRIKLVHRPSPIMSVCTSPQQKRIDPCDEWWPEPDVKVQPPPAKLQKIGIWKERTQVLAQLVLQGDKQEAVRRAREFWAGDKRLSQE